MPTNVGAALSVPRHPIDIGEDKLAYGLGDLCQEVGVASAREFHQVSGVITRPA